VNKSTWFTPASEGQVRVTRVAADPLVVRHQPFRKTFLLTESGGGMEQSADKHRRELEAAT
jgi:hypothetical protein